MPDETPAAEDREDILLGTPRDAAYWTGVLGVTEAQLRAAVAAVGTRVGDIRKYLNSGV